MITVILEVNKHLFKYGVFLEIDFETHMFGCLITCVWMCSLPAIKGHRRDPNEGTQLVNYVYLMRY